MALFIWACVLPATVCFVGSRYFHAEHLAREQREQIRNLLHRLDDIEHKLDNQREADTQ